MYRYLKLETIALQTGKRVFPGRDSTILQAAQQSRSPDGKFRHAIEKPNVGYTIVNGTSRTRFEHLSLRPARELLDWEPEDVALS